jgi:hypothetical protein
MTRVSFSRKEAQKTQDHGKAIHFVIPAKAGIQNPPSAGNPHS